MLSIDILSRMDNTYFVKYWRDKRNLDQAELAEKAGVSREYINKIENGKINPSFGNIINIADALEITLDELRNGMDSSCKPQEVVMSGMDPEDLLRARIIKLVCNMSYGKLERLAGYAEGMIDSEESKKNLEKVS